MPPRPIFRKAEYGLEGMVSTRGDVYSFGIVVMETLTRRKPPDEMFVGEMNLKQWIANSLLPDAMIDEVVDANFLTWCGCCCKPATTASWVLCRCFVKNICFSIYYVY
ncbi:hypothetical protein PRUPE_4G066800 [Prunus persica]|uniref:Serine-threonine/tyrosine-protein kinase catalytic domain-containing protein n=1 Tax=Prunus persica TaxID=3760 RepID=A0A251PGS5_PRUPE|nr:hypothetical protein PRUPE_4G066800 [Prunus persica]